MPPAVTIAMVLLESSRSKGVNGTHLRESVIKADVRSQISDVRNQVSKSEVSYKPECFAFLCVFAPWRDTASQEHSRQGAKTPSHAKKMSDAELASDI